MSKIVFFSLPAHGHTNPTIPVVAELTARGHEVRYYSFQEFKEKIKNAGAEFISCDAYLPALSEKEINLKAGRDFAALIEMMVDTAIAMETKVCADLEKWQPDCIVSDSLALWGELFAKKLNIPYVCSTTTFAMNQHTAKLMKPGIKEIFRMVLGMPRINKKVKLLQAHGYQVDHFVSLIQNDNNTDTIVYTSKTFQPMANTFSSKFTFVGPSIRPFQADQVVNKKRKSLYISLGTVLQNKGFYENCIKAFSDSDYDIVMSIGEKLDISALGKIPDNFTVKKSVDQISILQQADVFITHSGMNSVNESLYFGVPMILYPFHSEQKLIAQRVVELGAGMLLKGDKPKHLVMAVDKVMGDPRYYENAKKLSHDFQCTGGASEAAEMILRKIEN
ncbi:glycosyltransferase, MGT family [Gracilibacillus ureilyticus]|uniref:Glycosyltransferase, MGT family n=1 Tax=Gracilibacillus ureilyticus TaxID=531814 RepID=A0A1H9UKW9_9BACI|nr:macrolide family glycosyltransferase [Gracilibacillus ureilyticus]SES09938.1 glycosyltransferase, MGT family [Gracilibacillus ureilyticus]